MNRFFYPKLAGANIRKNSQTYLPYILTCITTVCMYYLIHALSMNTGLNRMSGASYLKSVLSFGRVVVALFSLIFLFYANSFLVKRRKKEFGLFNILGLGKKHIAKIVFFETLYVSGASIVFGLLGGILFSKLLFLALLKILRFEVQLGFEISASSILATLVLFTIVFLLTLLNNVRQVHLAKPIELLLGSQVGEREPKTKWLCALIGLASTAGGYYIALTTKSPLAAISIFFAAVVLVMIGTYFLFTAGSIVFLKILRKNKGYFYQPNHFVTVSGMLYRMKQNAVGLANICILSTMVLVTLSTTVSLYIGFEDILRTWYPRNVAIVSDVVTDTYTTQVRHGLSSVLAKHGFVSENVLDFRYLMLMAQEKGSGFLTDRAAVANASSQVRTLYFIPGEDYARITGAAIALADDEVLIYSDSQDFRHGNLSIPNRAFTVKKRLTSFVGAGTNATMGNSSHYLIVKNMKILEEIYQAQTKAHGEHGVKYTHYLGFDLRASREEVHRLYQDLRARLTSNHPASRVEVAEAAREELYSLYGGLFFLGMFLGVLFIMGTMLIIYYKQITEGYDDKRRFEIMRQVGMSQNEVRRAIRSQVLTVFFLPLVTAAIHIAFAFKFITRLLAVFQLSNIPLFAWCTVGAILIFALFYALVYTMTARVYYKIVS